MELRKIGSVAGLSLVVAAVLIFLLPHMAPAQQDRRITRKKAGPAGKERRLALVIGNGAYKSSPLRNPVNDAADMAAVLRKLGFQVIHKANAANRTMETAIRDFGKRLRKGGVGLFYFAGHGLQVKGRNYLIPVDAHIESESDVRFEAVDAGRVLGKMEDAGNSLNIVILDACRDNPFARSFRTSSQGLAQMDAPKGTIIAYATSPGSVAADGTGRNGIYTKHLLRNIKRPDLGVFEVFRQTGLAVMGETGDRQVPWVSSTPVPRYYLAGGSMVIERPDERPRREEGQNTGSLTVKTEPLGAVVYVEGQRKGTSPLSLSRLPGGKRVKIKASNRGYLDQEETVYIREGKETSVTLVLERAERTGSVAVKSNPSEAKWYLDGAYVGTTPDEIKVVKPGSHEVMVKKKGYNDWSKDILVRAGERFVVFARLEAVGPLYSLSAAKPIILGVPTSLGFLEGKEGLACVNMAVDEVNGAGGVSVGNTKRSLKVVAIDTRGAEPGVPVADVTRAHMKLVLEDKADFIIFGSFRSEGVIACMDALSQHKVPMILGTAMSPAMEKKVQTGYEKYKYTFRVCLNAVYLLKYLGGTMAYLNKQFGFNKVFIIYQDVAWARMTGDLMIKAFFKKMGWEVVGRLGYPTGSSDFSAGLMKAKAGGAQVILPIFDMLQSGILVKQWKSMKVPALVAGFISPLTGPGAWNTFDQKIDGAMNCVFEIGNIPAAKVAKSVEFFEKYKRKYGKPIEAGHSPAPAYEMVYILKEAIERAGTLDPDKVVAELEKTDRQGAMGRIRFNKGHQVVYGEDPNEAALGCMFQWQHGRRVIVYPASVAEGKIQLP